MIGVDAIVGAINDDGGPTYRQHSGGGRPGCRRFSQSSASVVALATDPIDPREQGFSTGDL